MLKFTGQWDQINEDLLKMKIGTKEQISKATTETL